MEIAEMLERCDIVEYISQYVNMELRGEEWWGISPFTNPPEKTPSFSVHPKKGSFYDFSSGIGGNVITFIRYYHQVSVGEAVRILKKYLNIDDSAENGQESARKLASTAVCRRFMPPRRAEKSMTETILPDNYMDRFSKRSDVLEIWRKEGISDEAMRFFDVRYDGFSNRLVYPIRNLDGKIINIGGRTLDPRYKEKGMRKYTYFRGWGGQMAIVYGLYENLAAIREKKEVIIFEGMKSVMLARDYGFPNCGALLTSHLNPAQMMILAKLGVRVVFALDKEVDITHDRNIAKLSRYVSVSYLFDFRNLLEEKDSPVDKGREVFETLYRTRYRYTRGGTA